jgi:hypothetical protein
MDKVRLFDSSKMVKLKIEQKKFKNKSEIYEKKNKKFYH